MGIIFVEGVMGRFAAALAAVVLSFAASSAVAQEAEHTPENAHKFVTQLSHQQRIKLRPPENYYKNRYYSTHGYKGEYQVRNREEIRQRGEWGFWVIESRGCKSTIEHGYLNHYSKEYEQKPSYYDGSSKLTVPGNETWNPYVPHLESLKANGIDWSRISDIATDGSNVMLRGTSLSGGFIELMFESPDMATRGAFAFEVIRQACDPVASTGF